MKVDDTEEEEQEERQVSDEQWIDEEEETNMREIVLALPALRISESFGVNIVAEEEEARLNEQAVVAAELVIAAAEEAVIKEKSDGKKIKKVRKPRKTMKLNDIEACGSSKGVEIIKKKPPKKKKSSELTNPPRGPPVCNICGRGFGSWKAVFGHLRSHKDRNYQGFHPPPKFAPVAERFTISGPNSAFVLVAAGGGSSCGLVPTSGDGGGAPGGVGGRGLGIDLNVEHVEEENDDEQDVNECGSNAAKFDLNKSPPKDEDEEDIAK